MQQWSYKTLLAGVVSFLGLLFTTVTHAMNAPEGGFVANFFTAENVGLIVAAGGALYNGWVARDDSVSSEGRLAPKDAA